MSDEKKIYMINGKHATHEEYLRTRYEDLRVRVVKGRKIEIQTHAETMERDNAQK